MTGFLSDLKISLCRDVLRAEILGEKVIHLFFPGLFDDQFKELLCGYFLVLIGRIPFLKECFEIILAHCFSKLVKEACAARLDRADAAVFSGETCASGLIVILV